MRGSSGRHRGWARLPGGNGVLAWSQLHSPCLLEELGVIHKAALAIIQLHRDVD